MAHEIENAFDRLDKLREKKEKREHEEAVSRAGFDNADDYDAWKVLEDLRNLTLSERQAIADAAEPRREGGRSITLNGSLPGGQTPAVTNNTGF